MKMKNRILSLFTAIAVAVTMLFGFGFNAFADQIRYFERGVLTDGTNTAYYIVDKDERVLYLTGDGISPARTPDYPSADEGPFAGRSDITRIVIENDVQRIGDYVFANIKSVDTLEIKPTLVSNTSMSSKAMIGCTGLRTVQGDSSFVSTDVLVEVVKGAINAFSGNWLGLVSNVINVGKDGFTSDGNLPDETIDALIDDYINTGESIYFDDLSTAIDGYNERKQNPCYYDNTFHHSYIDSVTTAPGCTVEGVRTYICSFCGDTYTESVEPLGHLYEEEVLYEPTCTKKGVKEYTCTRCGDVKLMPITATGHTPEVIPAVEPSCSETGLTEGSRCSVCGEIITPQETVATVPHTYSYVYSDENDEYTAICDICGYTGNEFENDISALVSATSIAKSLNPNDYTSESYNSLYTSFVKYINLTEYSRLAYPQYAVDEKTTEILTKINELVPYLELSISSAEGGAASFTVNEAEYSAPKRVNAVFGDSVTLTAVVEDGYRFEGWYETVTQRYLSRDLEYTFTLTSNTSLKAIFIPVSTSTLTFTNDTGQIVEQVTKTTQEWFSVTAIEEVFPAVPYKYGYTNGRWDYSPSQLLSRLRSGYDCTVEPIYNSLGVTLPEQPHSSDGITPALTLTYDLVQKEDLSYAGSFIMAADIPDSSKVVEIGTCFYKANADLFNPLEFALTINNKNLVSKYEGVDESGIYITNINKLTSKYNWSARGYVVYYSPDGKLTTAYTNQINIVDKSIAQ